MDITREDWHKLETIAQRWQAMETEAKKTGMDENEIAMHQHTYYAACAAMLELMSNRIKDRTSLDEGETMIVMADLLQEIGNFLFEQSQLIKRLKDPE